MDQEGKLCQFSKSTLAKALTFSHRPEAGVFDIAMPMLIVQIHSGLYTHRASFAAPPQLASSWNGIKNHESTCPSRHLNKTLPKLFSRHIMCLLIPLVLLGFWTFNFSNC